MKKIRIILPVLNEQSVILKFVTELTKVLENLKKHEFSILFVVDKSQDNTENIIEDICKNDTRFEAIIMSTRFGHQECLYAGLRNSLNYDAIIMMDCDLQHPPEIINQMIEKFENGYEIVNTSRYGNNKRNFLKRIGTNFFYNLVKKFAIPNFEKNSSDFRLISKKVNNKIIENFNETKILLRGIISLVGFKTYNIKFYEKERIEGKSKYNLKRMIHFGIESFLSFTSYPLFILFYAGIFLSLISFAIFVYLLISYFIDNFPDGWTTIVLLQIIFGSINLFFIGFLAIYISKIFDEVKARPKYIIDRIITFKEKNKRD